MAKANISSVDVIKVAQLANLPLVNDEVELFSHQFSETIDVINQLNDLNTSQIPPTSQVTNLENITRPDEIDNSRILSQTQALSQAKHTHQGFFVVPQLIDKHE